MVVSPPESRPSNLVVFGQPGTEDHVYFEPWAAVTESLTETLGIKEIVDIGLRKTAPPRSVGQASVTPMGILPPDRVRAALVSCRFGLLNYDIARLQKSSVFAAYAAHGVIPICIASRANPPRGLAEGEHFLTWPPKKIADLGLMQRRLAQWYEDHSIVKHAEALAFWCRSRARTSEIEGAIWA
jgi:hypothetical protein